MLYGIITTLYTIYQGDSNLYIPLGVKIEEGVERETEINTSISPLYLILLVICFYS